MPQPPRSVPDLTLPPEAGTLQFPDTGHAARPADIPSTFGSYTLDRKLGEGGMGAVYLAHDRRLNRHVAVKVMRPDAAAQPGAKERFLREARATAAIEHDHIIPIFAADEVNGVPYLVMPVLKGEPLDERLKREGRLPLDEAIRIAREVAEGLAAAQERGLIHRDIKPANVWLELPKGRVRILDFGLARPMETDADSTGQGVMVGTPAYMAPEQARGEPLDGRADLFALGVMLFQMLAGERPFTGPSVMAILSALANHTPPPVSTLNPEVPAELSALVGQLLAKTPADRPQTAAEVVRALTTIAQSQMAHAVTHVMMVAPPAKSAFASLDTIDLPSETPGEKPIVRTPSPAASDVKTPWVLIGVGLVVLLGGGLGLVKLLGGKAPPPTDERRGSPPPKDTPPPTKDTPPTSAGINPAARSALAEAADLRPLPPVAPRSAFDDLDPAKIPEAERNWAPPGTVGIIGGTAGPLSPTAKYTYSPDGRWLVESGSGNTRIMDSVTFQLHEVIEPDYGHVVGFSPDSRTLGVTMSGAVGRPSLVRLYDMAGPTPKRTREEGHTFEGGLTAVALGPAAKWMVLGSAWGGVHLIDLNGAEPKRTPLRIAVSSNLPTTAVAIAGGRVVAHAPTDDRKGWEVRLWLLRGGVATPMGGVPSPGPNGTFALSPDGKWLLVAGFPAPHRLAVWDVSGNEPKPGPDGPDDCVSVRDIEPHGRVHTFGVAHPTLWAFADGKLSFRVKLGQGCLAYRNQPLRWVDYIHPFFDIFDGIKPRKLYPAYADQNLPAVGPDVLFASLLPQTWAVREGQLVGTPLPVRPGTFLHPTFAADGSWLAGFDRDGTLFVHRRTAAGWGPAYRPDLAGDKVHALTATVDGTGIVTGQQSGELLRWNMAADPPTKTVLATAEFPTPGVSLVAHPGGKLFAVEGKDGIGLIPTGRPKPAVRTVPGVAPQFTPDGRHLLAIAGKQPADLLRYDLTNPDLPAEVLAVGKPWWFRLTADGRTLATVSVPGRFYEYPSLKPLAPFRWVYPFGPFRFTPDGRHLLVWNDGVAYLIRVPGLSPPTGFPPLDPAWLAKVQGLPHKEKERKVYVEMIRRNPTWLGFLKTTERAVHLHPRGLVDLTPIQAYDQLTELVIGVLTGPPESTPLESLEPLRGMKLEEFHLPASQVADLSPLSGMPIHTLGLGGTRPANMAALVRLPVQTLHTDLQRYGIQGWSIVRRWPLKRIDLVEYAPSQAARLEQLLTDRPTIVEVSGSALTTPAGDAAGDGLRAVLRKYPRLTRIQGQPAAEYWKGF